MNRPFLRTAGLLVVLITIWLLWSGIYTPLLIGLGALSCVLSAYVAHRIGFFERDVFSLYLLPRLPRFWVWLGIEVTKSSVDVARIILHRKLPISPTVVDFDAATSNPVGQAILGNSITLTPGTVTLDVHNGRLRVHCLTRAGADALSAGDFNRRVSELMTD